MRRITLVSWAFTLALPAHGATPRPPSSPDDDALLEFVLAQPGGDLAADWADDMGLLLEGSIEVDYNAPMSVGRPWDGALANGVPLPPRPGLWVRPGHNYGTAETVEAITEAVDAVLAAFPDTHPLSVGDISRGEGGDFRPHRSHQSGRDADIAYYTKQAPEKPGVFYRVTPDTIDLPRTWTFLRTLFCNDRVQLIFVDRRLRAALYEYAQTLAPAEELARPFFKIRHLRGHADHMHVRFRGTRALANAAAFEAKEGKLPVRTLPLYYQVRGGDSLSRIARRTRVKVGDLRRWNGLHKKTRLRPGTRLVVGHKRGIDPTLLERRASAHRS